MFLSMSACSVKKQIDSKAPKVTDIKIENFRSGGGSSGMEQIGEDSYLLVYDVKNFRKGNRLALLKVKNESLDVYPIAVSNWGEEGISSDLESICSVPGTQDEFLIAESGNWQGKLGRIFHIKVDTAQRSALVLGSAKLPKLFRNDRGQKGDQYEAILCLPHEGNKKIIVLGERGGSKVNPSGVVRWGVLDLDKYTLYISMKGLEGKKVSAPGSWVNSDDKRDLTDFHLDDNGTIWAGASEDQGDSGPFYSVVYKLGKVNPDDKENPVSIYTNEILYKEVNGFKIEALSGPCMGINSTLSFGTEDEMYGGVWRPLDM